MPLWDKKRKKESRDHAVEFLRSGALLIRQLKTCQDTVKLLNAKGKYLKSIMKDEGIPGVEATFANEAEIIKQKNLEIQFHRELQSLISPFQKINKAKSALFKNAKFEN